jgi:hypothetical protein
VREPRCRSDAASPPPTAADLAARPPLAENFTSLANLIASFPQLSRTSHFLFVPGPLDPWGSTTMPRPHIPDSFVAKVKARLPKAHFVSNPCRIKYFDQEIVIYREDLMGRMLRNLIGLKGGPGAEVDMKKYVCSQPRSHPKLLPPALTTTFRTSVFGPSQLVQTILDQCHLSPLPLSIRPTLWDFDHALRLYPMPTAVRRLPSRRSYGSMLTGRHDPTFSAHPRRQVRAIRAHVRGLPRLQPGQLHRQLVRVVDLLSVDAAVRAQVGPRRRPALCHPAHTLTRPPLAAKVCLRTIHDRPCFRCSAPRLLPAVARRELACVSESEAFVFLFRRRLVWCAAPASALERQRRQAPWARARAAASQGRLPGGPS